MARTNKRVQRTRKRLHAALMELLSSKRYELITVQDITEQAQLSRATFYLHYKDKDGLFSESIQEVMDQLIGNFERWNQPASAITLEPAKAIFDQVAENHQLYRVLLTDGGSASLIPHVSRHLAAGLVLWVEALIGKEGIENIQVPIDLLCIHTAVGMLTTIGWWLDNDMPQSTAYISELSRRLTMFGIMPFVMGVSGPAQLNSTQ